MKYYKNTLISILVIILLSCCQENSSDKEYIIYNNMLKDIYVFSLHSESEKYCNIVNNLTITGEDINNNILYGKNNFYPQSDSIFRIVLNEDMCRIKITDTIVGRRNFKIQIVKDSLMLCAYGGSEDWRDKDIELINIKSRQTIQKWHSDYDDVKYIFTYDCISLDNKYIVYSECNNLIDLNNGIHQDIRNQLLSVDTKDAFTLKEKGSNFGFDYKGMLTYVGNKDANLICGRDTIFETVNKEQIENYRFNKKRNKILILVKTNNNDPENILYYYDLKSHKLEKLAIKEGCIINNPFTYFSLFTIK